MSIQAILLPVFVQVALTGQSAWPERETQLANGYHNQLQLPVLFYVLVAFALFTRKADLLFVVLSWLFVLLRVAHAFVHVTSNHVPTRFRWFLAGALVLLVMWIVFAARIVIGL
jgi:hypothetical protein